VLVGCTTNDGLDREVEHNLSSKLAAVFEIPYFEFSVGMSSIDSSKILISLVRSINKRRGKLIDRIIEI